MAMSHEFERHIEFAMKGNNQRGVAALNSLKTQYEIFALAGIVPVLPKEQIFRSDQSSNINPVLEQLSEAVRSGSPYVANADTTDKLVRLLPGLTKENLYYWERKGLINPQRTTRGKKTWRVYSSSEALRIACIRKHLEEGLSLSAAVKTSEQDVARIMESK